MWACASSLPNGIRGCVSAAQILCDSLAVGSGRSGTTPVCSRSTSVQPPRQPLRGTMSPGGRGPSGIGSELREKHGRRIPQRDRTGRAGEERDGKRRQPSGRLRIPKWSRAALLCISGCSVWNVSASASSAKRQSEQSPAVRGGCRAWFGSVPQERCHLTSNELTLSWTRLPSQSACFICWIRLVRQP